MATSYGAEVYAMSHQLPSAKLISRRIVLAGIGAAAVVGRAPRAVATTRDRRPEDLDASVPLAWFDLALTLTRTTPGFTPPVAARALGYAGVTLYEAVVPGSRQYRSLAPQWPGLRQLPRDERGHDWPVVANAALAGILRSLYANTSAANLAAIDALETELSERARRNSSHSEVAASARRGAQVARAVFDWSRGDGGHEGYLRNFPPDYVPPSGPGLWIPTPPAFQPALQPRWGDNRPLVLIDGHSCAPDDPTRYSEQRQSAFFGEAREVYDAVNNRTPEQEAIALFWSDDPGVTASPPGHSISVATQVLRLEEASLMLAAETYAKVGMAVCDAFIACWKTKYIHNLLRPVTYIQRLIDPTWLPLLNTPPFPEYTSGHSVQSAAAFGVLADLFGDSYSFDDHTHDNRGLVPRRFGSFSAAAEEAALSRLYGGIHFRPAIEQGLTQGRCIAEAVNGLPVRRLNRHGLRLGALGTRRDRA